MMVVERLYGIGWQDTSETKAALTEHDRDVDEEECQIDKIEPTMPCWRSHRLCGQEGGNCCGGGRCKEGKKSMSMDGRIYGFI